MKNIREKRDHISCEQSTDAEIDLRSKLSRNKYLPKHFSTTVIKWHCIHNATESQTNFARNHYEFSVGLMYDARRRSESN